MKHPTKRVGLTPRPSNNRLGRRGHFFSVDQVDSERSSEAEPEQIELKMPAFTRNNSGNYQDKAEMVFDKPENTEDMGLKEKQFIEKLSQVEELYE